MGIVSWIIVGILAGWLTEGAGNKNPFDSFNTALIAIFGALLGGGMAGVLFHMQDPISLFNLSTLIVAFLGAVLTVTIARSLPGHSPV
jgi:uncharacterized membrane protein YeaQ/YmgE (transglycosylase-associated protein family)